MPGQAQGAKPSQLVSVVVLAAGHRGQIGDCLEGLAQQHAALEPVVTVVDSVPSDGSSALALANPGVHWVLLTSQSDIGAMCQRAAMSPSGHLLAFVSAACRPGPDWLAAGLAALEQGADVVLGEVEGRAEATDELANFFVARHVPFRIPFAGRATDDDPLGTFVYECRAAGFQVVTEPRARVKPIVAGGSLDILLRNSAPTSQTLPGTPPRSVRRYSPAVTPSPKILVSVVLCTGGTRPTHLRRCLESLARLNDASFEVIVVDNGRKSSITAGDVEVAGAKLVREPKRGLDRARNRGIAQSSGEIVAFVDDDCVVDPGWIKGLRDSFKDPLVQFVTGRVRPSFLDCESQLWFEEHFSFDRGPFPQRFTRFDASALSPLLTGALGTGANMAFRRGLLERIGGFDPALDMGTLVGGGGDLDMFARALDGGEVCEYSPDAIVFHHHRETLSKLRWQTWGYGVSQGALCAKCLLGRRGRRIHAVRRYLRLLRDHVRRLEPSDKNGNGFPPNLVRLELFGIAVGPLAYLASVLQQRRRQRK